MHQFKKFILITTCLLASSLTNAETYYVSPNGTATWTQCAAGAGGGGLITSNATHCNGKTAVENAIAGDIVYFRSGTYDPAANPVLSWSSTGDSLKYEHLPWNPSNSGTPTNPITFMAYPGETSPVFLDNIYGGTIGVVGRDWIIWDGFTGTIVNYPDNVIVFAYFQGSNNCVFRNGNITGTLQNTAKNSALIYLLNTNYTIIENNRLHDMNDDGVAGGSEAVNAAGILNFNSRNMVIKNNDIYNNYLGIWDKDTEQNNMYYRNHIWGGNTATTRCHVGIQINEQEAQFGAPDNARAYQNVIRNCSIGASVYEDVLANNTPKIYNNVIFYDSGLSGAESGISISGDSRNAEIYNNIIDGYSIALQYEAPVSTTVAYSNQNSFFNSASISWRIGFSVTPYTSLTAWTSATTFDTNSILTNPTFVNAGGTNPADYKLDTNSPALGTGRNGVNLGAYPISTSPSIGSSLVRPKSPLLHP